MMTKTSNDLLRSLITFVMAALLVLGTASAQDDAAGDAGNAASGDAAAPEAAGEPAGPVLEEGEVLATFYSELPSAGGEPIAESDVGEGVELDQVEGARYVVLTTGERSYLFAIHSGGTEEGDVRLDVAGEVIPGESPDDANAVASGALRLVDVAATLLLGVRGDEDLLLIAGEEQGTRVVRYIAPRAEVTAETPIEVEEADVIVTLRGGVPTILEIEGPAATAGELQVGGPDGSANILDETVWEPLESAPEGDMDLGIGVDPAGE